MKTLTDGPFSHMFELFINRVRQQQQLSPWHHESASIALVDLLIERNELPLERLGLLAPQEDIRFVKALIEVSLDYYF